MDLITLRTILLITLSVMLLIVLYQRFKRKVKAEDLPALAHAELRALEVAYHPARLLVHVHLPDDQALFTELSDDEHRKIHAWPEELLHRGERRIERELPKLESGTYHFEISTATQRTVRRFRLLH